MAYQRTEYHREVRDENEPKQSWKEWFGLGDKNDRDEDRDRGYNVSSTRTYRTDGTQGGYGGYSGDRNTGTYSTGYSGARGGYGYTTSDEANIRPSWNSDRDYNTRQSYGQSGDQNTYTSRTRTYGGVGGDRDWNTSRNVSSDNHPSRDSWSPSRTQGQSQGYSSQYTSTMRDQPSQWQSSSRDNVNTSRGAGYGGDSYGVQVSSRGGYGGDSYASRGFSGQGSGDSYGRGGQSYGFDRDNTTSSRYQSDSRGGYGQNEPSYRRETTYTSGGVGGGYGGYSSGGYGGDRSASYQTSSRY